MTTKRSTEKRYRALLRLSFRTEDGWLVVEEGQVFTPPPGFKPNPRKVEVVSGKD